MPMTEPTPSPWVATSGNWDIGLLEPLTEINERVLEALAAGATGGGPSCSPLCQSPNIPWRTFGAEARQRLASCPYLLIDGGFARPELWVRPLGSGVRDARPGGRAFAAVLGPSTVRCVLMLAWHLARANRLAGRIALGLSEPCAALIAAGRLRDMEALAEAGPWWISPRWESRSEIWRQLLEAAVCQRPARLRTMQLRGLQLLAASVLPL
jgi:hypothetical protein